MLSRHDRSPPDPPSPTPTHLSDLASLLIGTLCSHAALSAAVELRVAQIVTQFGGGYIRTAVIGRMVNEERSQVTIFTVLAR